MTTTALPKKSAKLSPEQVEAFGKELDDLRARIVADLGEKDANYIRGVVGMQKRLEIAGRCMLWAGWFPPAWVGGVLMSASTSIVAINAQTLRGLRP